MYPYDLRNELSRRNSCVTVLGKIMSKIISLEIGNYANFKVPYSALIMASLSRQKNRSILPFDLVCKSLEFTSPILALHILLA